MGKVTLVLGGTRSGKSDFATNLASKYGNNVAYIATSPYYDEDMARRIEKHKQNRPSEWVTYEEEKELSGLLKQIDNRHKVVLIECLTLYVSNFVLAGKSEEDIKEEIVKILDLLKSANYDSIIVSNEVGMGVHPEHAITREFRDIAGRTNQMTAEEAQDVYFVVSGIPIKIKENDVNKYS